MPGACREPQPAAEQPSGGAWWRGRGATLRPPSTAQARFPSPRSGEELLYSASLIPANIQREAGGKKLR
jgi:hypothetical protein